MGRHSPGASRTTQGAKEEKCQQFSKSLNNVLFGLTIACWRTTVDLYKTGFSYSPVISVQTPPKSRRSSAIWGDVALATGGSGHHGAPLHNTNAAITNTAQKTFNQKSRDLIAQAQVVRSQETTSPAEYSSRPSLPNHT